MTKRARRTRLYEPPLRGAGSLASAEDCERLEWFRQNVYVNKKISAWLKSGLKNKTLTAAEARRYFEIFEEVLNYREQVR